MNQSDIEMIDREVRKLQLNPAVAYALMRIQHDMNVMMEKITRIEESLLYPPSRTNDEDDLEFLDPPF
jgi:hypothetical protein